MEIEKQRECIVSRKDTYGFLSSMFLREATVNLLQVLRENAEQYEGAMGRYACSLKDVNLEQARIDAAADFSRILLGMSPNPAMPYESAYTSGNHWLMQESRDEAVQAYGKEGYVRIDGLRIPEDHIGIELEFMALLCEKELAAFDAGDEEALLALRGSQKTFLRDHLLNWIPELCDDILARQSEGLYAGLSEVLLLHLRFEAEEMDLA